MEIAVMGATGNVGSELVELLRRDGHRVRALSRSQQRHQILRDGVSSFAVDLTCGASLHEALAGAEGAFMLSGYDNAGLIAAMVQAGTSRVALLSSSSVGSRARPQNAVVAYHLASEQALRASQLSWTFLRPNTFMTNALRWVGAIRNAEPIVAPFADVPVALNDPRDIAAVAAAALVSGDHAGQIHRITGPEALRPAEQVEILGEVLGQELRFEAQSDAAARAEMEASMPAAYVDAFFEFFAEGKIDETTVLPTVRDVTGTEPREFRAWALEHAAAFR